MTGTLKENLQDNEERINLLFKFLKEIKYYNRI